MVDCAHRLAAQEVQPAKERCMSDVEKTVEETPDQSIIVVRERQYMWAIYFAFIVLVAAITFGVMELLFGGR
jgi:hypothetical protein